MRIESVARRVPNHTFEPLEPRQLLTGALDTLFSSDGKLTTPFNAGGSHPDTAAAIAVDRLGRTVAVGAAQFGSTDHEFTVARYRPDGSLDTSFSGDGKTLPSFDLGGTLDDRANDVAIDAVGRIVVV